MNIINGKIVGDGDDVNGDVGIVIKGNTGTVHLGNGDVYVNSRVVKGDQSGKDKVEGTVHNGGQAVTGDGVTFVRGNNIGGISRTFGGKKK